MPPRPGGHALTCRRRVRAAVWATALPGMIAVSRKARNSCFRNYVAAETATPTLVSCAVQPKDGVARATRATHATRATRATHATRGGCAPCSGEPVLLCGHRALEVGQCPPPAGPCPQKNPNPSPVSNFTKKNFKVRGIDDGVGPSEDEFCTRVTHSPGLRARATP